jgi:tetratricopeptide (TPR) repeat protein
MQLYTLRFEQGRLDELQAILQRTTRFFDRIPALQVMTSLVLFRSGRPDEARAALIESAREHFAHIPRDSNWLPTLYAAAIVASELSLGEVARDLYELLGPHAHRNLSANHGAVNSGSVGRARAALAECLGRPDDALVQFERALESDERLGSVPAVLNTQILFGPVLLRRGDEDSRRRGRAMLESVIEKGEPLGFARLASKARAALAAAPADPQPATGLRACWHEGEFWTLRFEGRTHRVRDAKGMRFIAQLLARPAQALAATQLVAYESPAAWIPDGVAGGAVAELEVVGSLGDAGPRLDERARREYAAHLSDLRTERDEAERLHDLGRLSAATEQIEWLSRELATASGLDGRPRRSASHVERARLAVRQRIKATFDRLERSDPALARFLTARIRTGTVCAYEPAPGEPPWDVRLPR